MSRISPGTLVVGIFAILFGLVGAYAVRKYFQKQPVAKKTPPQTYIVPLASTDIEPGRPLTMGDVSLLKLTREQIRQRNLPAEYMASAQQIIGRTLRDARKKGEAFLTSNFYPEGMGPSVSERLKPGLRAVTVPMEGVDSDSGLTSPGTYVDVIFRTEANQQEAIPETTVTLLEKVEVLAVGPDPVPGGRAVNRTVSRDRKATRSVTLAVSPVQANALKVVENRGALSLAMRGADDDATLDATQPTTLHGLLGIQQPKKPFTTEIYRAGSRQTLTFEGDKVIAESITGFPIQPRSTVPTSTVSDTNTNGRRSRVITAPAPQTNRTVQAGGAR